MTINNYWLNQEKYLLHDAAYLVCGLEPQSQRVDYEQSGAPVMVIRAYVQMKSHAINQSYLWEQYYISRDDLCYYAYKFGGEGVVSALGFDQTATIQGDNPITHNELIRAGGYCNRDSFAVTQLENRDLLEAKSVAKLLKELNSLADASGKDIEIFNATWWRDQKIFPPRKTTKER